MCALWQTAQGQGTKADYERAYALRGQISGKVFKERISPQWLGGPHFWYQNRLRDGREWVLVDGAAGKRQAFSDKAKFEKARDAQGSLEISRRQVACVCARLQCVDSRDGGK